MKCAIAIRCGPEDPTRCRGEEWVGWRRAFSRRTAIRAPKWPPRSTWVRTGRAYLVLSCCFAAVACQRRLTPAGEISVAGRDSAGVAVIRLPLSLAAIADGHIAADTLQPDLVIRVGAVSETGYAADVATLDDGTIAVLDRLRQDVRLFDRAGHPVDTDGGAMIGHGQLHQPIALAAVGGALVVMEVWQRLGLLAFDRKGRLLSAIPQDGGTDWRNLLMRGPLVFFSQRVGEGPEPYFERLARFDDASVVVELKGEGPGASAYLVRYPLATGRADTLWSQRGAGYSFEKQIDRLRSEEPVYAPLMKWAPSGTGDVAIAAPGEARVQIVNAAGDVLSQVEWAPAAIALGKKERLRAAQWYLEYTLLPSSVARARWAAFSNTRRRDQLHQFAETLPIAPEAPEVEGLFLAGNCLWLSGWNAADALNGAALTWLVLNWKEASVAGVVRIPLARSRVQYLNRRDLYTTSLDSLGVSYVERYPITSLGC